MIPADLATEIKNLVSSSKTEEALRQLEDWVNGHGNHKQQDLFKLLKSDYNTLQNQFTKGVMSNEEYQRALAKINAQIFEFLNGLSQKELEPIGIGDKGRIMHNIPGKMVLNEMTECIIRIAKDDEQLLRDFVLTADSKVESIAISKKMEVELADPTGGKAFHISTISTSRQFITRNDFTQWIFDVMPLLEGSYRLAVKAMVIEEIDGKEERRDIVYRNTVTVVASRREATVAELMPSWKPTNIVTADEEQRRAPFAMRAKPVATVLLALVTLVALGIGGYFLRKWINRPPSDNLPDVAILIDSFSLSILTPFSDPQFFVNSNPVETSPGQLTGSRKYRTQLRMEAGQYTLEVRDGQGKFLCAPQTITLDGNREISFQCEEIPVPPKRFSVRVELPDWITELMALTGASPGRLELITDGRSPGIPAQTRNGKIFFTVRGLTAGMHKFEVPALNTETLVKNTGGASRCGPLQQNITTDNQRVVFPCPRPTCNVTVTIPKGVNIFSNNHISALRVSVDGRAQGVQPALTSNKSNITFRLTGIPIGKHTFKLTGYKADQYQCNPVDTVLLRDGAVNFSCLIIVHD